MLQFQLSSHLRSAPCSSSLVSAQAAVFTLCKAAFVTASCVRVVTSSIVLYDSYCFVLQTSCCVSHGAAFLQVFPKSLLLPAGVFNFKRGRSFGFARTAISILNLFCRVMRLLLILLSSWFCCVVAVSVSISTSE